MHAEPITAERIIHAAEEELRRHGPAQLTVVGIAERLGVSHAALYRHFPSKIAIYQAIAHRWLESISPHLARIAADETLDPPSRLVAWFHDIRERKLEQINSDPELFAMYALVAKDVASVVEKHIEAMLGQLTDLIEAGIRAGCFTSDRPAIELAETLWWATTRFHNPKLLASEPSTRADLDRVLDVLIAGIAPH